MKALEDPKIYLSLTLFVMIDDELLTPWDRNLSCLAETIAIFAGGVVKLAAWKNLNVPVGLDFWELFSEGMDSFFWEHI